MFSEFFWWPIDLSEWTPKHFKPGIWQSENSRDCESQLSEHSSENSCKSDDECLKYEDYKSMGRGSLVTVGVSFRTGWALADLRAVFISKLAQEEVQTLSHSKYPNTIIFFL